MLWLFFFILFFMKYSFDAVIHCAAVVGVDRTKREPMNTITTEYDGTRFLLELSINNSVKKFINMSSSEVYGNSQLPMREDGPVNPNLDYGLAKLLSERMTKIFCDNSTMDTVSFRLFNVYGPRQREEFVVPIFIKNALDNKPLLLYGKDEMFRDFTYVSDVVDATEKALRVKCNGCVVNIASGIPTSIAELAHRVIELCNSKSRVITGKRRDGEIISRWASVLRASELLHFRAKTSLDTGLKKTIEWYRRE